jgi:molecular chaperone DnaJ
MQSASTCPNCSGEGRIISDKCKTCFGEGIMRGEEVISINIPAGVGNDMQLSVSGKGNAGPRSGVNGDLIVQIEEVPHDKLKRDGNNLIYEHYLNFADASLGTSIDVPTLEGLARVKIDEGTQSGKLLRLRGKGLPELQGYGKGDLIVNLNVWTPQKLSADEKKLLEKLRESENFKPNPGKKDKSFFDRMKEYFE